ncbi:hypothetical protein MASR1M107_15090 [Ignavibacteriales bacterium]
MQTLSLFILILLFGYLGTATVLRKISNKNYFPSGAEYVILGLLLSPSFFQLFSEYLPNTSLTTHHSDLLLNLSPVVSSITGFIGLYYGLQFSLVELLKTNREGVRVAIYDSISGAILSGGTIYLVLIYLYTGSLDSYSTIMVSAALGIISSVSTPYIMQKFSSENSLNGKLTRSMLTATKFSKFFAILLFGSLFPIYQASTQSGFQLTSTEFLVVSFGISVAIGVLFFMFLGREMSPQKIIAGVFGVTLLGSGIGYFLGLSPLFLCFIIGALVGNISKMRDEIIGSLNGFIQPLSIVVVVYAGMLIALPSDSREWIMILAFPVVKFLIKYLTHKIAVNAAFERDSVNEKQFVLFLGSDVLIFAMLINYVSIIHNSLNPVVVISVVIMALLYNTGSGYLTKRFLVETDEIRGELK